MKHYRIVLTKEYVYYVRATDEEQALEIHQEGESTLDHISERRIDICEREAVAE